jgi:iron(III) transport system substrate-binding protein
MASGIPASFRAPDGAWTGFAARARVLLVNTTRVPAGAGPRSVRDLADPRWKGRVAMANPLFGTTTMHVAAWFVAWGEDEATRFLAALKANDVRVAGSNGDVKRLVVSGEVAFGIVDTDDAHEAVEAGAPVEMIYPDQDGPGTLVMPTTVVALRGSPNPDGARRLIDHLLAADVERRMAESAHMPLRTGVPVPPGVLPLSAVKAMPVDYERVAAEMEHVQPFLRQWVGM